MKEYIERGAALSAICVGCGAWDEDAVCSCFEKQSILDIPVADVVEVVRCKDCEHGYPIKSYDRYLCGIGCGAIKNPTDFCNYGERRADNE